MRPKPRYHTRPTKCGHGRWSPSRGCIYCLRCTTCCSCAKVIALPLPRAWPASRGAGERAA
jgi:hypothetical protein